jgi:membrane-bound lytic murein transglycosylase B
MVLTLGLLTTGAALMFTIGVTPHDKPSPPRKPTFAVQPQKPQPGAGVPRTGLAAPPDRPNVSDQAELDAWAEKLSTRTQVPARVLAAYGRAEMWMRSQEPACQLSWATLAGIGRVESQHGYFDGADVARDGHVTKPIFGPALDGSPWLRAVPDTDGGKLDGDAQWDRAIGPMQLLPATWKRWSERANGDGAKPDPQNIDDAALTAAVLTYNQSTGYAQDVFSGSDAYAAASLR